MPITRTSNRKWKGAGPALFAERLSTGRPDTLRDVGSVDDVKISQQDTTVSHIDRRDLPALEDGFIVDTLSATGTLTFSSFNRKNLALLFYGTDNTITGSTPTNQTVTANAVLGGVYTVERLKISAITLKSGATPVAAQTGTALVLGTDYEIDTDQGLIRLLLTATNVTAGQSVVATTYTYAAQEQIAGFAGLQTEKYLILPITNYGELNNPLQMHLYKVRFEAADDFNPLAKEFNTASIKFKILKDDLQVADTIGGQFFKILQTTGATGT